MNCAEIQVLVTGLLDGELDPDQVRAVEGHLAACEACRTARETERAVKASVAQLRFPELPADLRAALRNLSRAPTPRIPAFLRFASAAASIAILAFILMATQGTGRQASASVQALFNLHEASQAADADFCGCCRELGEALRTHVPGGAISLPAEVTFRGFLQPDSVELKGRVPCFAVDTPGGRISIFLLPNAPTPAGASTDTIADQSCLVVESSRGSMIVVCGPTLQQVWVSRMPAKDLRRILAVR